jgi:ribosome-associated protein
MEDTFKADKLLSPAEASSPAVTARKVGELLSEHNAQDVAVLDLRELNGWTDFFVIATVTSRTHTQGLLKFIRDFARETGTEILHSRRKAEADDEWNLVDLGAVVVHLMSSRARDFYELERLWGRP